MANQSVLNSIPDNTSFLQTTRFTFVIPQLPFLKYFCQTVLLPGVSTTEALVPTPFSDTYRHGDKLVYDPLSITTLVDEDLRVFEETYQWLSFLTNPIKFGEFKQKFTEKYYDGVLTVNTNSNIPNMRIKFRNCHPVTLGSVQFATTDTADITPVFDVTFRYDIYQIERL
jgi:hypothetical protein